MFTKVKLDLSIGKLKLEANDILVLKINEYVALEEADKLREYVEKKYNIRCMVISKQVDLMIVKNQ